MWFLVNRKTSGTLTSNADPAGGGQNNVVDVSRSSSSGQDSPTKPDRRRRVSIYFNNKKGDTFHKFKEVAPKVSAEEWRQSFINTFRLQFLIYSKLNYFLY